MDNWITLNKAGLRNRRFKMASKMDFFQCDRIIVKVNEGHIIFTKPDISYQGKSLKLIKANNSDVWKQTMITDERLVEGKFEINEDDFNEDELFMYFK